ncbi:hypothetical protein [Halorubellus litoreus]|uniref:Uncharacterized protein n=1 Tax=Halorubellus litoreus TaxID=755308 RepID=A0ABD5VDX4_9EURY
MQKHTEVLEQGTAINGSTRRVAPPVIELTQQDVADASIEGLDGSLVVLYGKSDSPAIDLFDSGTDVEAFQSWLESELSADADSHGDDVQATAELSYCGRTVTDDLTLAAGDTCGVAVTSFNGGDLDESGFKIEEDVVDSDADVEYRLIVVPPTLDEGEQDAMDTIPEYADGSSVRLAGESEVCGTLLAAGAFVVSAGAGYAVTSRVNSMSEGLVEASNAEDVDADASVDELIDAQS